MKKEFVLTARVHGIVTNASKVTMHLVGVKCANHLSCIVVHLVGGSNVPPVLYTG